MKERLQNLTVGIALLIGLMLSGVYFYMMYDDGSTREQLITNLNNDITKAQSDIDRMNRTLKEAQVYREVAAQLGAELETVVSAIPEKYNSLELMKVLSTEAKGVGLSILSLNAQSGSASANKADKNKFYEEVGVQADFEGTFNQIVQFMSNLTKVNRIILLKELKIGIKGQPGSTASPMLTFDGKFEAFRYLPATSEAG